MAKLSLLGLIIMDKTSIVVAFLFSSPQRYRNRCEVAESRVQQTSSIEATFLGQHDTITA